MKIVKCLFKNEEFLGVLEGERIYKLVPNKLVEYKLNEVEYSSTRVKPEVREVLTKAFKLGKEQKKVEDEIVRLKNLRCDNCDAFIKLSKELLEAQGLMSVADFGEKLERLCFSHNYHFDYSYDNKLVFSRVTAIEKWYKGCLVYYEYDDTAHLDHSNEKEINRIIKKYQHELNVKAKYDANLYLGDKRFLHLEECYTVDINKPLTDKYLNELATKLRGWNLFFRVFDEIINIFLLSII